MATTISYGERNSGFQAGVIHGNVGNITIVQSETLNQACLRDLRATNPIDDKERIKNTKGGLLKDSYHWILDNKEFREWQDSKRIHLLWIRGDPGKGKTMLLCGLIEELTRLYGDDANISFFFCQATDTRINSATSVLRGLIYLLVEKNPSLLPHVRVRYERAGKALFEDVNAWNALVTIFRDILNDPTLRMTYLVIDALDECTNGLHSLLDLIVQESAANLQIKWVVSSRNWPEITERLDIATQIAPVSLELNEVSVSGSVNKFIQHKVNELSKIKRYNDKTRDTVYYYLLSNSQGTFLWVALVCQNLEKIRTHVIKKLKLFPPGLNSLYGRMIDQVHESEDAELCKEILAIMSTVFRPLTLHELTSLIERKDDDDDDHVPLEEIIALCGSFLTLRERTIIFVHQSAKEYLLKEALDEILPGGIGAEHNMIFARSFDIIFKTIQRDILNIKLPGVHTKDICKSSPNPLAMVEYACVYWMDHLQERERNGASELSVYVKDRVDAFLQQKFLSWLEVLSILGSVSDGIKAMQKLESLIEQDEEESGRLLSRARDASRFIRYHRTAIESSPLQVYCSPLIFSPLNSLTRISFQDERPDWVLNDPMQEQNWSTCLQALEGHGGVVNSISWSPDGQQLTSASDDKSVRIWDSATGKCTSALEGHSDSVTSITWSPDGGQFASASVDKIIRTWDSATGQCVSIIEGHSDSVTSITWSPDGSQLASASVDCTAMIWDLSTGHCASTLEGHSDSITSITWSPDGAQLASASVDKTLGIWDPATGHRISTLEGHSDSVTSITWSPDGSQLASVSADDTIRIWDLASGQCTSTLDTQSNTVLSIAWSPDGSRLASSRARTVRIWNLATGQCEYTLKGHTMAIKSIAWSPSGARLASASYDKTVRIWDPAIGHCPSTVESHSHSVRLITWSPDGSWLASASADKTVRVWNPDTGKCASNLEGHSDSVTSIAWSPDGRRLTSAAYDKSIRVWEPTTSQCLIVFEGHNSPATSIAWSPDGTRLASSSYDKSVRIWDPATAKCTATLQGHSDSVYSVAWSPDGNRLASTSIDETARVWDLAIFQCTAILKGHEHSVESIAWSPDGNLLASTSIDTTVRVWDPVTGQCASIFQGHTMTVTSIVWSPDGSRLVSASYDNTVRVWDPATGKCTSTLNIHSPHFLQFDKLATNYLHTTIGIINLASTGLDSHSLHGSKMVGPYGYGLSVDFSWINYDGLNLLWLPAEYRPSSPSLFAISASRVAIGCSSGHVIFLSLSERKHPV